MLTHLNGARTASAYQPGMHQISDGLGTAITAYDGANRPIKTTDPEANFDEPTYDKNGNVTQSKRTEKAQSGAAGSPAIPDEIFITKFASDVMNRQTYVETQGPDGDIATPADNQISRTAYNSRGLATHFRDALDNTRLNVYDGAGRALGSDGHLRVDGTGATVLDTTQSGDGIIRVRQGFDGNSRRISLTDDNNNVTTFGHDALDRQNRLTFADGRSRQWAFDRDSNVTRYTDENGSVSDRTYDALNRLKDDTITRAVGVIGTTLETFQYDGLSRNTRATDNGDPADAAQSSVVTNVYDSLGRQLEESLQIGSTGTVRYVTGSKWSSDSDRMELTYPNDRKVQSTHDELGRLTTLKDDGAASPFATLRWMGSRVLEMAYASGICLTHLNNARTASAYQPGMPAGELRGFDGAGRMVAHRWLQCTLDAGFPTGYVNPGTALIGFRHAWNAADNKLSQELMHGLDKSEAYKYDSAYRLKRFDRGTLNAALTDVVTPTPIPNILQAQTWTLDGPGNWPSNTTTIGGTPTTETRTHNNLNQITAIDAVPLTYDSNGNLTDDGTNTFAWDAKNRLRRATRKSDNVVVGLYAYDALGRRIRRVYIVASDPAKTVHYYLDGQRVIEEREIEGSPPAEVFKRQYTYGPYIDECLTLDRDLNGNGIATDPGERLFYLANTLYSICALLDSNRNQPERYLYDAYGRPVLWLPGPDGIYGTADDIYGADAVSLVQNTRMCTGTHRDADTNLSYYRARQQSARLGRFVSREPDRDRDGPNVYSYVGNQPSRRLDPSGAQSLATDFLAATVTCQVPPRTPRRCQDCLAEYLFIAIIPRFPVPHIVPDPDVWPYWNAVQACNPKICCCDDCFNDGGGITWVGTNRIYTCLPKKADKCLLIHELVHVCQYINKDPKKWCNPNAPTDCKPPRNMPSIPNLFNGSFQECLDAERPAYAAMCRCQNPGADLATLKKCIADGINTSCRDAQGRHQVTPAEIADDQADYTPPADCRTP